MNYVRSRLDKAGARLAKNDYRRALTQLELACWNLSHTDAPEDFDRLEQLLDQVAAGASGRTAEKAMKLQDAAQPEIDRRRLMAATQRPSQPTATQQDASSGVGAWVAGGAGCGLLIGTILGASVASSGGGDIQSLNDLAALFCAALGTIVGSLLGLLLGVQVRDARGDGPGG